MFLSMPNIKKNNILFFDIEYDDNALLQFGGILMKRHSKDIYQVAKSISFFVKRDNVSEFISRFLKLTVDDLQRYGVEPDEAVELVMNEFIGDIPEEDLLIVSQGVKQDMTILFRNGIKIEGERLCNKSLAERVKGKNMKVSLPILMEDFGLQPLGEHDAYEDAMMTMLTFSALKNLEEKKETKNEEN